MRPASKLAAVSVLLGASGLGARALAAQAVDFSVSYAAPPDCSRGLDFQAAVTGRTAGANPVERSEATLALEVAIAKEADGFAGALVIELPDGSRSRREAFGADCNEVFESLAVIAAIALDGYRATSPRDGVEPPPAGATPANTTSPAATPASEARPAPAPEPEEGAQRRARLGVFAGAAWESAVAPRAPFGATAGFELAGEARGPFWPNLRLGVLLTGPSTTRRGSASAEFRLVTGRLAACPLGFGSPEGASAHVCIELDAGALRAEGFGVVNGRDEWLSWLAAGPAARAELALTPWLSLEATAGGRLLARRYHLVFSGADSAMDLVVYDMPALSAGIAVGVAARLP